MLSFALMTDKPNHRHQPEAKQLNRGHRWQQRSPDPVLKKRTSSNSAVNRPIYGHVSGLLSFCSLHDLKLNRITFVQGSESLCYNRCVVDKNVWPAIAPDKTISF